MHSSLLESNGLINFVAGSDYNFRIKTAGDRVKEDVERALRVMEISPTEIYSGQQVHGDNISYVDGKNGRESSYGKAFPETDGLITDQPGIALLIKFADCTPIVLFDPIERVQVSVHSGWRGTVQKIVVHAIEKMEDDFDCNRENIVAYVGPSIDQKNYEVGSEVYKAFHTFKTRDNFFERKEKKYLLSMQGANLELLKQAGIKPDNIQVEKASTYSESTLHSARKEGNEYQLNAIITMFSAQE